MRINDGKGHIAGGFVGPNGRYDGCLGLQRRLAMVIRTNHTDVVAAIKGEGNVCRSNNWERHDLQSKHTRGFDAHGSLLLSSSVSMWQLLQLPCRMEAMLANEYAKVWNRRGYTVVSLHAQLINGRVMLQRRSWMLIRCATSVYIPMFCATRLV